jgi:hypothetical protein
MNLLESMILVNKFYLQDFSNLERKHVKIELHHYEYNVAQHSSLKELSNISELCQ